MIKKWRTISSKKLFEHPRLSVYEDIVELPTGKVTDYIHFGNELHASIVLARNNKQEFLIQKEYSHPPNEVLFQLPGGLLEKAEDPSQGAIRELSEEAGITGKLTPLGYFYANNRRSQQRIYMFLATDINQRTAQPDQEEFFEDFWMSATDIENKIANNEITNYTILCAWAAYKSNIDIH